MASWSCVTFEGPDTWHVKMHLVPGCLLGPVIRDVSFRHGVQSSDIKIVGSGEIFEYDPGGTMLIGQPMESFYLDGVIISCSSGNLDRLHAALWEARLREGEGEHYKVSGYVLSLVFTPEQRRELIVSVERRLKKAELLWAHFIGQTASVLPGHYVRLDTDGKAGGH